MQAIEIFLKKRAVEVANKVQALATQAARTRARAAAAAAAAAEVSELAHLKKII